MQTTCSRNGAYTAHRQIGLIFTDYVDDICVENQCARSFDQASSRSTKSAKRSACSRTSVSASSVGRRG